MSGIASSTRLHQAIAPSSGARWPSSWKCSAASRTEPLTMRDRSRSLTRRQFLGCSTATALAMALPRVLHADQGRLLVAASRQIEVEGKAATVFGLTGPDDRPGLTF